MRRFKTFLSVCLLFFAAANAFAAQDSTVVKDNAPIRMEPNKESEIIEYLPEGLEVRVSSYPLEGGWYKVRSKTSVYGWLHESFLSVMKESEMPKARYELVEGPKPERDRKWVLRAFGGFSFFNAGDLNNVFGFDELKTGTTFGGEAGYDFADDWTIHLRMEAMIKDVVANESVSQVTYNLGLRSYPLMAGLSYSLAKGPSLRFSLGAFGGLALTTSFSSQAISLASPNLVVLQQTVPTFYIRANVTRPLGRVLSIFGELGYRILKTSMLDTTNVANGGTIYLKDSLYQPREIDLSGPVAVIGIGLHL